MKALHILAAAMLLLAPGAEAARAGQVSTQNVSGLPWRSGASAESSFGSWRGRPLDVRVVFVPHRSWSDMTSFLRTGFFRSNCNQTPLCVVSMPSFPHSATMQHQRCAGGEFDANHRELAGLVASAKRGAVVRLAWEANSNSGHPWRIVHKGNIPAYKACFRRLAQIYRGRGLLVEWTNSKTGSVDYMDTYPGDDVVDLWGIHQYDNGLKGVPFGEYVSQAARHGKRVGVGEWGLWRQGDRPDYMRAMFAQFRAHARNLAYENYYNNGNDHQLHPRTKFRNGAAAYKALWGR